MAVLAPPLEKRAEREWTALVVLLASGEPLARAGPLYRVCPGLKKHPVRHHRPPRRVGGQAVNRPVRHAGPEGWVKPPSKLRPNAGPHPSVAAVPEG